jgi:hypothetical protein
MQNPANVSRQAADRTGWMDETGIAGPGYKLAKTSINCVASGWLVHYLDR